MERDKAELPEEEHRSVINRHVAMSSVKTLAQPANNTDQSEPAMLHKLVAVKLRFRL